MAHLFAKVHLYFFVCVLPCLTTGILVGLIELLRLFLVTKKLDDVKNHHAALAWRDQFVASLWYHYRRLYECISSSITCAMWYHANQSVSIIMGVQIISCT